VRLVYIVEERPKEGEFADRVELTFYANKRDAERHFKKTTKDDEVEVNLYSRYSGGTLLYEGLNG